MEEIEAGTDIQHVISSDRHAHPSTFWLGDLRGWGYYEISTHSPSPPSVPLCLPPFSASLSFSLSHCLPLTSPALSLQLSQVFVVSHPVVFHRHWDRPEPAWSKEAQGTSILHSCPRTQTHTSKHCRRLRDISRARTRHIRRALSSRLSRLQQRVVRWGWGLTIGGSAPPADWWHLLVLVVLVTVQYSIFLHQRKTPPTLLVQVGVWWLRSIRDMDVRLRIVTWQISLVVSVANRKSRR